MLWKNIRHTRRKSSWFVAAISDSTFSAPGIMFETAPQRAIKSVSQTLGYVGFKFAVVYA
jgi:hypothetical protein